jgi:predicted SAM-dependent methyltransferase
MIKKFKKLFNRLIKAIRLYKGKKVKKRAQSLVKRLIVKKGNVNLEIGSGPKNGVDNWITLDICDGCDIKYNLLDGIPFPDESVNMIYASHFFEHFYYNDLLNLLLECKRVLKSEGIISICVPDSSIYIRKYLNPDQVKLGPLYEKAVEINAPIDYVNYMAYMNGNHKYMFDQYNMKIILTRIGFRNCDLREFDSKLDLESRKWESLHFEAIK